MTLPRFTRALLDLEVEITDPDALAAYLFDYGTDSEGNLGMVDVDQDLPNMPGTGAQTKAGRALLHVLASALQAQPNMGIKFVSGNSLPRPIEDGQYTGFKLVPLPLRNDDGKHTDEP